MKISNLQKVLSILVVSALPTVAGSDPFYGASPVAVAEKVWPQMGGERSGMTPDVVREALLADPVGAAPLELRGVRLGMTLEKARAALMAAMPEGSTFEVNQYGGVGHLIGHPPTGPLTADTPGAYPVRASGSDPMVTKEVVAVEFALPPAPSVVRRVVRNHPVQFSERGTQTSVEVLREALIEKYGPPDDERTLVTRGAMKWLASPDKEDCNFWRGTGYNWHYQRAGHPADCSTALVYSYGAGADGVVTTVQAQLGNAGLIQLNTLANRALWEVLRENANAAERAGATDKPEL